MFKELMAAFGASGHDLDRAFSEFSEMLDHSQWMFVRANEVLKHKAPADEVRESIYQRDKSINNLVRSIRRKIVRHLTIHPGTDVAACLALMSVAKDAERIGDYCKNVFEVGQFYDKDFELANYHDPLETIRADVESLFKLVAEAFQTSSTKIAKAAIENADDIGERCNGLIEQLLQDKASIHTHEAVAYSLLARHYKRVSSHLANICTGVLGKIEDLDFRRT